MIKHRSPYALKNHDEHKLMKLINNKNKKKREMFSCFGSSKPKKEKQSAVNSSEILFERKLKKMCALEKEFEEKNDGYTN